jgi:DNA-binding HxlR family transcriptional regulator
MAVPIPLDSHAQCQKLSSVLNIVGDKWTVLVVRALMDQPRRFNEIKRTIGGISQQMLTRTLRALERDGLVTRTVHPTVPPQVEYALTRLGHSLSIPLRQLGSWAGEHLDDVERNRVSYDARKSDGREVAPAG